MSSTLNGIVFGAAIGLTVVFAWVALYAPIGMSAGDRAFLVACALSAPSAGALLLYFLCQETR